ncbi:ABC transporter permease [Desulfotignum balticum]|jgi:lipopolysaccharide transport system permease protein|uniref:ABC transporter permease n=1 Tax=Desulfotignum balticum TaxID=115781 RepID=UPI000427E699|nr:ABC transporter permease [Desulfotignum balticum]
MKSQYEIIKYRAIAELKAEIRRGFLGIIWWILEPVLYMTIFYIVFAVGLRGGGPDFVPFLLTGLVVWKWFATSINRGSSALLTNANLIRQVNLPKYIFPSINVIVYTFKFFIIFTILLIFLAIYGIPITPKWFLVFVLVFCQMIFILSITFWSAALVPIIPDLKQIIENCMMLLFFSSGIFFDLSNMEPRVKSLLLLNPIAWFVDSYRSILLKDNLPNLIYLGGILLFSIFMLYSGYQFLRWYEHEYPKIIR